jgi:hypothetical protein
MVINMAQNVAPSFRNGTFPDLTTAPAAKSSLRIRVVMSTYGQRHTNII